MPKIVYPDPKLSEAVTNQGIVGIGAAITTGGNEVSLRLESGQTLLVAGFQKMVLNKDGRDIFSLSDNQMCFYPIFGEIRRLNGLLKGSVLVQLPEENSNDGISIGFADGQVLSFAGSPLLSLIVP